MSFSTTIYYFVNDLFRLRGQRITIKDLEEIASRSGSRVSAMPDKLGAPGVMSRILLKAYQIDIMRITIEAESEEAIRETLRGIKALYGPYETFRGKESSIAKKYKDSV
ncbi:MAG: hypothetical protein ACO0C9_01785 [Candidatus Methanosuratincola verstraetei]|jgi:hypothetical protein|uniref:Uncharacterized protein n=1 Tax=Methanosuratincola subterraneus TaxID=2593994 RepID=A0A3S4UFY4_METS7|nr:MAG: hypothetical protein Metus_0996 [Candidatus Methanosuratincola subterraneus]